MTELFAGFRRTEVAGGIPVLWLPTQRFKTFAVAIHSQRPVDGTTAARALLPALLLQETESDVDRPALARRMEGQFGASVGPGASRYGESEVLRFTLDTVSGEFLPDRPDQLAAGLSLLGDIALRPRLQGDGFPEVAFEREQRQALASARSLQDDKTAWARQQALVHGCKGEPYSIPPHGGLEAIEALQRQDPEIARRDFLRRGRLWCVAMGALPDDFPTRLEALTDVLTEGREPEPVAPPVQVSRREPGATVEWQSLQQSKQVLLFRFPPPRDAVSWAAIQLAINLLGGGPHARLFREVREKRSFAYCASATGDLHKGIMLVQVGLDAAAADAVRDETLTQLRGLAGGELTTDELQTAKATILGSFAAIDDSIAWRMRFTSELWLMDEDQTPEQRMAVYAQATPEAVAAAAESMWLDHVYLLAPEGDAKEEER